MGVDAMDWVFHQSQYKGELFAIHLAISDGVADACDNCFYFTEASLASKAHCTVEAVRSAIRRMIKDGYLEIVQNSIQIKDEIMYRFLMPEVASRHRARQERS